MPAPEGNSFAAGNPGGGRPTAFDPKFVPIAEKMGELGATDQELADAFGVSVRTIYSWKHEYEEFSSALKVAKEAADERVERSLFQKAIGYEQEEVKIFMPSGADKPVYAPFRAKIAPDTTAAIFWLKNRRSGAWKDKHEVEHSATGDLAELIALRRKRVNETLSDGE